MSLELTYDRGECQGQVTKSEFQDKKNPQAAPRFTFKVATPGGVKSFKVDMNDMSEVNDGDLIRCQYAAKTFLDDKTGKVTGYTELLDFKVVMPAAIIAQAFTAAAKKAA